MSVHQTELMRCDIWAEHVQAPSPEQSIVYIRKSSQYEVVPECSGEQVGVLQRVGATALSAIIQVAAG